MFEKYLWSNFGSLAEIRVYSWLIYKYFQLDFIYEATNQL
jgi:hypothetical protein